MAKYKRIVSGFRSVGVAEYYGSGSDVILATRLLMKRDVFETQKITGVNSFASQLSVCDRMTRDGF